MVLAMTLDKLVSSISFVVRIASLLSNEQFKIWVCNVTRRLRVQALEIASGRNVIDPCGRTLRIARASCSAPGLASVKLECSPSWHYILSNQVTPIS